MKLGTPVSGRCALCAFRYSEGRVPYSARLHGARYFHLDIEKKLKNSPGSPSVNVRIPFTKPGAKKKRGNPSPREVTHKVKGFLKPMPLAQQGFADLLVEQINKLEDELLSDPRASYLNWGIESKDQLHKLMLRFRGVVKQMFDSPVKETDHIRLRLRRAFTHGNLQSVYDRLKYDFMNSIISGKFTRAELKAQSVVANLRQPMDWYPATRELQREIHLHVGPTNSGKTYHALKRLEAAKSGIYAGPLRLLAHEVYTRLNAKGKTCALITGEERRIPENMAHAMSSCTVEMVPLNTPVEVAVIDEIQKIGDTDRGWAWTQAFLGVQAKEVHLCGELRTVELITSMCKMLGDKLTIHKYERLSPLKMSQKSLRGNLLALQKGDAVIMFSRLAIHAMKADIEKTTGKRCAVVYGSLPPETRAQQAALFNDPDNDYDILVASDAVGMGLNLSINRVIFESTSKFDGTKTGLIETSDIKQIAGRAGRFRTANDTTHVDVNNISGSTKSNCGYVTSLESFDLPIISTAMATDAAPIKTAGLYPPTTIINQFVKHFPAGAPFSYGLKRLEEMSQLNPMFHFCNFKDVANVADVIEEHNLNVGERLIFCAAPTPRTQAGANAVLEEFAHRTAEKIGAPLFDLKSVNLELLDEDIFTYPNSYKGYLREAEALHQSITLYLWLSYRFPATFSSQALAFHAKGLVEEKINFCLAQTESGESERKARTAIREQRMKRLIREAEHKRQSDEQDAHVVQDALSQTDEPVLDPFLDVGVVPNAGGDAIEEEPETTRIEERG